MLGVPMTFALGSLACIFLFVFGTPQMLNMLPARVFPFMTDYQLSAIPLFIFMAAILEKAGIIEELFDVVYKWLGGAQGRPRLGDGRRVHDPGGHGRRRRRHRGDDGHDRPAGHAAARLRRRSSPAARCWPAARSASSSRPRSWRSSIPWSRSSRWASCWSAPCLPGFLLSGLYIAYVTLRCYINPSLGPALPLEERVSFREKLRLLRKHDRADPPDPAGARRDLLRRRHAGRGGRHRHLRRA